MTQINILTNADGSQSVQIVPPTPPTPPGTPVLQYVANLNAKLTLLQTQMTDIMTQLGTLNDAGIDVSAVINTVNTLQSNVTNLMPAQKAQLVK